MVFTIPKEAIIGIFVHFDAPTQIINKSKKSDLNKDYICCIAFMYN